MKEGIQKLLDEGFDQIEICHKLNLRRYELGEYTGTGPWTGKAWNKECERRGYKELMY